MLFFFLQGLAPPWFGSPLGGFLQFLTPKAAHIVIYSIESLSRTKILKHSPALASELSGFPVFSVVLWLLASWLLGFSGSWLLASRLRWLLGFSASVALGFSASVASRLQWLRGSWLLGFGGFLRILVDSSMRHSYFIF